MNDNNNRQLYTINEAAYLLRVDPLTIRRWQKKGFIKFVRVVGKPRITREEIDRVIGIADIQHNEQDS